VSASRVIPTAIIGVTGYEGANCARILARHPFFRLVAATARSGIGQPLGSVVPALAASSSRDLLIGEDAGEAGLVILAVPHGPAATLAARFRREGRTVIDVSADFRLRDPAIYARWYGHEHPTPDLLPEAVYGLSEWHREELRGAALVANPGCFPTAVLLAVLPALVQGAIEPDIIADAKTGISGAGRSPSRRVHFAETAESVAAYGVTGHRHLPEMEQELAIWAKSAEAPRLTFVPHLVPINRGILATCYATLRPGVTEAQIHAIYRERSAGAPFVQLIDQPPETGWVRGSNVCLMHVRVDAANRRLIVISALDNLMKGGAGQAVQNANLIFGIEETAGLAAEGVWP
jgi:N-acetyl-gamma-glutamyl-phosphate reductase